MKGFRSDSGVISTLGLSWGMETIGILGIVSGVYRDYGVHIGVILG